MLDALLASRDLDLELATASGETALWRALASEPRDTTYPPDSAAAKLFTRGASVNAANEQTGECACAETCAKMCRCAKVFACVNVCTCVKMCASDKTCAHRDKIGFEFVQACGVKILRIPSRR